MLTLFMHCLFEGSREGSLHTPYELSKARKDYEAIAVAIKIIEKSMEDRDMLNVSDQDVAVSTKSGGKGLDELVQRAVSQKSMVDAEFQKVAAAADAAVAVIRNPSTTARREI